MNAQGKMPTRVLDTHTGRERLRTTGPRMRCPRQTSSDYVRNGKRFIRRCGCPDIRVVDRELRMLRCQACGLRWVTKRNIDQLQDAE